MKRVANKRKREPSKPYQRLSQDVIDCFKEWISKVNFVVCVLKKKNKHFSFCWQNKSLYPTIEDKKYLANKTNKTYAQGKNKDPESVAVFLFDY